MKLTNSQRTEAINRLARKLGFSASTVRTITTLRYQAIQEYLVRRVPARTASRMLSPVGFQMVKQGKVWPSKCGKFTVESAGTHFVVKVGA